MNVCVCIGMQKQLCEESGARDLSIRVYKKHQMEVEVLGPTSKLDQYQASINLQTSE